MLAFLIEVAVIAAVIIAIDTAPKLRRRRSTSWLESITLERVLVHTSDDQTFEGNLAGVASDGLLLKAVRLVDENPVNVAGDVFIPRSKIVMVQRPTGGDS